MPAFEFERGEVGARHTGCWESVDATPSNYPRAISREQDPAYCLAIRLRNTPKPSTSVSSRSPACMNSGGLRA